MGQAMLKVDCRGMQCPAPILQIAKAAKDTRGEPTLLEVVADDADFPNDLEAWCRTVRATLHEIEDHEGEHRAVVGLNGAEDPTSVGNTVVPFTGTPIPGPVAPPPPRTTAPEPTSTSTSTSTSGLPCLDLCGLVAPEPLVRLSAVLGQYGGASVEVVCDDPRFLTDLLAFSIMDPKLDELVSASVLAQARENVELALAGYSEFDRESYQAGHLAPVVFGSALRNYGTDKLVELVGANAPAPQPRTADTRDVDPGEDKVTGFVFKVQANMDRNHRDRIAFMRVCSGHFHRGMKLRQVRTSKDIMVSSPIFFMAQDREIAEDAWPGDVIGIPNHGTIRVGDTMSEGETFRFTGLPAFAPEILRRVLLSDTTRVKQMRAALNDLAEEGLIQVFKPSLGANWIIGVIGVLQLDVLKDRARQEYRIELDFESVPYETARWLRSDDDKLLADFIKANSGNVVTDRDASPVFLARNAWDLDYTISKNEGIEFQKTRELE